MISWLILKRERPMISLGKKVSKVELKLRAFLTFLTCLAWVVEEEDQARVRKNK
jgi:hypothetical protein